MKKEKTYGSITITKIDQLYTWIKFAKDKNGLEMSDDPNDRPYMGIAYNKDTPVESTDPGDYTWTSIKSRDCEIESSNGTSFEENQTGKTTLTARIYDNATEIDGGGRFTYKWYFKNDSIDEEFAEGKIIEVNIEDIIGKSIYFTADDGGEIPDFGYAEGVDF